MSLPVSRTGHGPEVTTDALRKGDAIICAACPPLMTDARPDARWSLSQFKIGRELGSGFASVVYQAQCRLTSHPCVIKVYKKNVHEVLEMQIAREIAIHSKIKHPHAIDLYAAFGDAQNHYLVLEFMPHGDLFAYLEDRKHLDEASTVRRVAWPMLQVLRHLHQLGVIHRDIKPENIMIDDHGTVKLADFGLSIRFTDERPVSRVGTLDYMPPEVLACADKVHAWENKNNFAMVYGTGADVWALGVLVYETLFGWPPFSAKDVNDLKSKQDSLVLQPPAGFRPSRVCWDFLNLCMTKDAKARPTCAELLAHPWIRMHMPTAPPKVEEPRDSELVATTSAINEALGKTPALEKATTGGEETRKTGGAKSPATDGEDAGRGQGSVLSRIFTRNAAGAASQAGAGKVAPSRDGGKAVSGKENGEAGTSRVATFAQRVKHSISFRRRTSVTSSQEGTSGQGVERGKEASYGRKRDSRASPVSNGEAGPEMTKSVEVLGTRVSKVKVSEQNGKPPIQRASAKAH